MNLKKINTLHLIIVLGLIILITPLILTLPSINNFFDLSEKGQIGDTLGGITSSFINAIAAILVFIAFKEQVRSNDLIKEQLYFQHIQDQINRLEDKSNELSFIVINIRNDVNNCINLGTNTIGEEPPYLINLNEQNLNQILYSTSLFNQTLLMIDKTENDRIFLYNKLRILYKIMYKDNYFEIRQLFNTTLKHTSQQLLYIIEILTETKNLEENEYLK